MEAASAMMRAPKCVRRVCGSVVPGTSSFIRFVSYLRRPRRPPTPPSSRSSSSLSMPPPTPRLANMGLRIVALARLPLLWIRPAPQYQIVPLAARDLVRAMPMVAAVEERKARPMCVCRGLILVCPSLLVLPASHAAKEQTAALKTPCPSTRSTSHRSSRRGSSGPSPYPSHTPRGRRGAFAAHRRRRHQSSPP